jgi:hypothetical protein
MNTLESHADSGDLLRYKSIRVLLKNHPRLFSFLFNPTKLELRKSPSELLCDAGGFSHGEIIFILLALDIWSDHGGVSLTEVHYVLGRNNWISFLEALNVLTESYGHE